MVPKPEQVRWKKHFHLLEVGGCYLHQIILEEEDTKAQFSEILLILADILELITLRCTIFLQALYSICLYVLRYIVKIPSLDSHTTL